MLKIDYNIKNMIGFEKPKVKKITSLQALRDFSINTESVCFSKPYQNNKFDIHHKKCNAVIPPPYYNNCHDVKNNIDDIDFDSFDRNMEKCLENIDTSLNRNLSILDQMYKANPSLNKSDMDNAYINKCKKTIFDNMVSFT